MNDDERARFYENPENRRVTGQGRHQVNVGIRLSNGALASVSRRFLGGQRSTVNSARHRVEVTWK